MKLVEIDIDSLISGSKNPSTEVPTKLSELEDDATHRLVTDVEKATWTAKANITKTLKFEAQTDITEFQIIGNTITFASVFADGRLLFNSEIQGDTIVFNETISQYQQVVINYVTIS